MLDSILTFAMRRGPSAPNPIVEEPEKNNNLPDEIVLQIFHFILRYDDRSEAWHPFTSPPSMQTMLARLCRVDRQWYRIAIPHLYAKPWLFGHNFELFVRTICPTWNDGVRRSDLAGLVKELDLRLLVHQGSKSTTARLIGRTKASLEVFRAPRSTFGINCFAALSKCAKLRTLDLSRIGSAVHYDDLVRTLIHLPQLQALDAPKLSRDLESGGPLAANKEIPWPPSLSKLRMARLHGDINGFLWLIFSRPTWFDCGLPRTITTLIIQDATVERSDLINALQSAVPLLRDLTLTLCNTIRGFNDVLMHATKLERLCISINLITSNFPYFGGDTTLLNSHPLRHLEIATCSGTVEPRSNILTFFSNVSLSQALAAGKLSNLRRVNIWKRASVRFRIDELEFGLVHARLVQLSLQDGFKGAGMRVVDEPGWDGMITLE
jgi:hypothetical protein